MADYLIQTVNGEPVQVQLLRKKVKRLTLRLDKTGAPILTVPTRCTRKEAQSFLSRCEGWLAKNLHPRSFFLLPQTLTEGDRVLLLGERHTLHITQGRCPTLTRTAQGVTLCCRTPQDPQAAAAAYEKAMRSLAQQLFSQALQHWHGIIAHKFPAQPQLTVKAMTGRWGSASVEKGRINMSLYLLKAPPACISYIALHETAHFLVPNHSREFYRVVALHMPDYKQREAQLKALAKT